MHAGSTAPSTNKSRNSRSFDGPEGVEDDGAPPELAAEGWKKVDGEHHLLGWRIDRQALSFLLDTGADLDVDEYG